MRQCAVDVLHAQYPPHSCCFWQSSTVFTPRPVRWFACITHDIAALALRYS